MIQTDDPLRYRVRLFRSDVFLHLFKTQSEPDPRQKDHRASSASKRLPESPE
jgi:hypothetical protein